MNRFRIALISAVFLLSGYLLADGFPLKDGRYAGGPTVEIQLTKAQTVMIAHRFSSGVELRLTKTQRSKLKSQAKLKVAPTTLMLFHAADLAEDCTCFAANWAFDFKPGWVEVPIVYLCSDKEAEGRRPDPNG